MGRARRRLVLFHPAFVGVGGAELLASRQARALHELGFHTELLTFGYDAQRWTSHLGALRVEAQHACIAGRAPINLPDGLHGPHVRWAVERLSRYEAILAHNFPSSAITGGAAALSALRIWYCHEPPRWLHVREANPALWAAHCANTAPTSWAMQVFRGRLLRAWQWSRRLRLSRHVDAQQDLQAVRGLDHALFNSEFTRGNAERVYGPLRGEVVYPMVHFPRPRMARQGLRRDGLRVVTVTRLESVKNVDLLLRGFALFRQRCPGARLAFVGEGPTRPRLAQLARELGVHEAVKLHGFVPLAQMDEVLSEADVFAALPIDEPFGMVFPEAAAQGLLLVGPDHGGPAEIMAQGELGELANAFSPQSIAEALDRVWRLSDAEADRRRERALLACRARFSTEAILRQLERLFAQLL